MNGTAVYRQQIYAGFNETNVCAVHMWEEENKVYNATGTN